MKPFMCVMAFVLAFGIETVLTGRNGGIGRAPETILALAIAPVTRLSVDSLVVMEQGQVGINELVELRPEVLFAKTLKPPTQRSHKIYYVDQRHGNDANPGTRDRPWCTIQKAADTLIAGDTVLVKDGTYAEEKEPGQTGILITRSGAPNAYITYKAFPGSHPHITSSGWTTFNIKEAAYIELEGFDITATVNAHEHRNTGAGIWMEHSHHIRIRSNTVHDCGGGGICSGYCDYLEVEKNTVHDNAFFSIYDCSGISLWENRDFDTKPGFHYIVRRNLTYRNENKGTTPLFGGQLTDGNGIIIDVGRGQASCLIENNICFDNGGRGIQVDYVKNVVVRNNTCVGNDRTTGIKGFDLIANTCENVQFINNIVVGRDGQAFTKNWKPKNVTYQRNLFYNYTAVDSEVGPDNLIGQDPLFVHNSMIPEQADFHLRPGSPALRAGLPKNAPFDDFEGHRRRPAGGIDLGALQKTP